MRAPPGPGVEGPRRGRGAQADKPGAARPRGSRDGHREPKPGALRGPRAERPEGARAKDSILEAMSLTRDLSWELRSAEVQEEGLSAALSSLPEVSIPPGVECTLSVEDDETLLPSHVREQLFVILRLRVRNAVSHSEAGRMYVEVRASTEEVAGCVRDDGRGFAEEDVYAGGGLRSMKERGGRWGRLQGVLRPGGGHDDQGFYPTEKGPGSET